VAQAKKDFAQQIALASGMEYRILKSTDAEKRHYWINDVIALHNN